MRACVVCVRACCACVCAAVCICMCTRENSYLYMHACVREMYQNVEGGATHTHTLTLARCHAKSFFVASFFCLSLSLTITLSLS